MAVSLRSYATGGSAAAGVAKNVLERGDEEESKILARMESGQRGDGDLNQCNTSHTYNIPTTAMAGSFTDPHINVLVNSKYESATLASSQTIRRVLQLGIAIAIVRV